jgi:hypothetical protein
MLSYRSTDVLTLRPFCISTDGRLVIWLKERNDVPSGGSGGSAIYLMSSAGLLRTIQEIDTEPFVLEPFSSRTGFHLEHDYGRTVIQLPYWFLTLLFAATAGLPWIRWRFTLRTLLIATTLVAVLLGLIAYSAR